MCTSSSSSLSSVDKVQDGSINQKDQLFMNFFFFFFKYLFLNYKIKIYNDQYKNKEKET